MGMNKKGQILNRYMIALLVFCMIIAGFTLVPNQDQSFFEKNGYTPPTNTLGGLDQTNNVSVAVSDMVCDINPESYACKTNPEKESILDTISDIVGAIFKRGWGVLVTISKTLGITEQILENSNTIFGLPDIIVGLLISMVILTVILAIASSIVLGGGSL